MALSKKHYIAIAKVMRENRESYSSSWDPNLFRANRDIANALAHYFTSDNHRFDGERFLKACGL
jgi:hypothetical protein